MNRLRLKRANSDIEHRKKAISRVEKLGVTLAAMYDEFGSGPAFDINGIDLERLGETVREAKHSALDDLPQDIANRTGPADSRYENHAVRVTCLLAALDECSTEVTESHVDRAMEFIEPAWESLSTFVGQHLGDRSDAGGSVGPVEMAAYLRKAGEPMTQQEVADSIGVSPRRIRTYASQLRQAGLIDVSEGGGSGNKTTYRFASE